MEAKELQIMDWVSIFDPDYKEDATSYQVSEIREDGIKVHMFTDTYEEGWFEPIKLTPEILEKNGWIRFMNDFRKKKYMHPIGFELKVSLDNNFYIVIEGCKLIILQYVHELQHALRLCGLSDLADNFKVV